jgi:polysaccharide export outer membrane protein
MKLKNILTCLCGIALVTSSSLAQEIRKARDVEAPAAQPLPAAGDNYRVKAKDRLSVTVDFETDLSGVVDVQQDGTVRLKLIDEVVKVQGMSVREIETRIRTLLAKDYIKNPKVTVGIFEMSKTSFSILGQVGRPGRMELRNDKPTSVLDAIAMAGGFTRLANEKEVLLKRTINGQEKVYTVNAKEMARTAGGTIYLQEGDILTIKESTGF